MDYVIPSRKKVNKRNRKPSFCPLDEKKKWRGEFSLGREKTPTRLAGRPRDTQRQATERK